MNGYRNLISARELDMMKRTAYLINTARGGIVDEAALAAALRDGRIAGAALDCFAGEPLTTPPPFAALDNVLLAPHCIAWTDELFRDIGRGATGKTLYITAGKSLYRVQVNKEGYQLPPRNVVRPGE